MNPYEAVKQFEAAVAEYAGAKFAVAVESCSAALFLACCYVYIKEAYIPKHTYPSVANAIILAGGKVKFHDNAWSGTYTLEPYQITDGALRFSRGMYKGGLHCLSFHIKKHLPIGRGGMILCDDEKAVQWLKRARFDGRDEVDLSEQKDITLIGWNMYMTPEQASRGLQLFNQIKDKDLPDLKVEDQGYPDLSKFSAYQPR